MASALLVASGTTGLAALQSLSIAMGTFLLSIEMGISKISNTPLRSNQCF